MAEVSIYNTEDNIIPQGAVVCALPQRAWMSGDQTSPPDARRWLPSGEYPVIPVRRPTEEDENLQDASLVVFVPGGLGEKATGKGYTASSGADVRGGYSRALLADWTVGAEGVDVNTNEQYAGMPVGIRRDSYKLHAGGCCFRLLDWQSDGSSETDLVYGTAGDHPGVAWFKAEGDKFSDGAAGVITDDLLSAYYLGRPDLDNGGGSAGFLSSSTSTNDAIQVRAYHAGSSISDGSYGQISRVGGHWVVSAVYC